MILSNLKSFKSLRNKNSTDYNLLYYLSQSLYEQGNYQEAYNQFSKTISIYPDSGVLYNNRGNLLIRVREFQAAFDDYTTELRLARNDEERKSAFLNIAAVQLSVRDFEHAAENLEKAYEIDSLDVGTLINLANAYSDLGKKRNAIKYLERAIQLDSSFLPSVGNLGFIHLELEEYSKALSYFDMVLSKDKDDPFTLNNRGYVKYKLGDNKGALEDINLSIKLDATNSYAYRNRALVYLQLKKINKVCEDLQLALEKDFTIMYGDEVNQLIDQHCK
jgi:tetratricopeptide (TPR) repeat protein